MLWASFGQLIKVQILLIALALLAAFSPILEAPQHLAWSMSGFSLPLRFGNAGMHANNTF